MQIQVNLSMMLSTLIYLYTRSADSNEFAKFNMHLNGNLCLLTITSRASVSYNHRKGDVPTEKICVERLTSSRQKIQIFISSSLIDENQ